MPSLQTTEAEVLQRRSSLLPRKSTHQPTHCIRLNKECIYPGFQSQDQNVLVDVFDRLRHLEENLDVNKRVSSQVFLPQNTAQTFPGIQGTKTPFPAAFFLDNESFRALEANALSWGLDNSLQRGASNLLGVDRTEASSRYFSSVHPWFSFLSQKRLNNGDKGSSADLDGCERLLILCFGLLTEELVHPPQELPQASRLYSSIRASVSAAVDGGCVSLRLVQSLVLLSLYELGHAIYPTAYLTLAQAARMGTLMGLQSKTKASRLFTPANSWTLREEQRRTWWAILILDRFANIGAGGQSLCAPDPTSTDLLPVNDTSWDAGQVVANEPLYTTEFCCVAMVSPLARTCQAAHMLGKIIQHGRDTEDPAHSLAEALQIHRALSSLLSNLELREDLESNVSALSLCCSAIFLLYDRYQANESDEMVRLPAETELQHRTLESIRGIASSTAPKIAQIIQDQPNLAKSLLNGPSLYRAANICAWFIREDHDPMMYEALEVIVAGLRGLQARWPVAGEYLKLLRAAGVLEFVDTAPGLP
ncbi:unnamed protein product [Clonostachys rhizophaga]|uniref:Xylanolytic transcriptional activator regulatory domain-containing protein n=1 Tax=Clonostachys rhizophaga TaxID=160324 RepID=A0A9N9YKU6_9HYPO|nr:unnamed protein product [Clonostachys rhizophaga]